MPTYPASGVDENTKKSTQNFLFPKGKYRFMLEVIFEGSDKKANKCVMKWVCHDEPYKDKSFWQEIPIIDPLTGKVTPWFKHTMHQLGCLDNDAGDLSVNYEMLQGGHYVLETYVAKGKSKNDGTGENWPDKTGVNSILPMEYGSAEDIASSFNGTVMKDPMTDAEAKADDIPF